MSAVWIAMVAAGALTFLIRFSFIGILGRWKPPVWVQRALRYVPPAVLAAIILPEVLVRDLSVAPLSPRVLSALLAILVAWRTRSAILAIVAGMAALLLLQFLGL